MRLHVKREYLDSGGYTRGGRYFGIGAKLWYVSDDDGRVSEFVRAPDARAARERVAAQHGISLRPYRARPSRAGKSAWDIETKIREAKAVRHLVADQFHPLFDHLLELARSDAKPGALPYQRLRAGRYIGKAKAMAKKYPAEARDRRRRSRRHR